MKSRSLGLRLILLACASIGIALIATGFLFSTLFHSYFEERMYRELENQLNQLTANIALDDLNSLVVAELPDPRFELPFSGLYWQVLEDGGDQIFSRSLWGEPIETPPIDTAGRSVRGRVTTPGEVSLLTLSWRILIGDNADPRVLKLTVAVDEAEVTDALAQFRTTLVQWLALLFVFLIVASWAQVRLGLAPLEAIRNRIQDIRSGEADRLDGAFPREVMPLADEVNELLRLHEESLKSARSRASDMAHGLKTPLTVMLTLAQDAESAGQPEISADIREQVEAMHAYVERELARTRMQVPSKLKLTRVKPTAERMVNMISRLPREVPVSWQVEIPDKLSSPLDEHDMSELLGNLLDNARKWARSRISLTAGSANGEGYIRVEDDGPGVPQDEIDTIKQRGHRLDDTVQGTGLGLAICEDMAIAYGAKLDISLSEMGGLAVTFLWPTT